ncbi:MAG: cation:proton antiporter [Planctomycetia bacterium]|nr:cation:proton antiporter [Planctomycetia bacterium]
MHNLDLIMTLTGGLAAALLLGYLARLLQLSPMVGYLIAGIAVGPYTPGFNADHGLTEQLAEVGIILMMFSVGMHFHPQKLWSVRRVAVPGAFVQSFVATILGAIVARAFGWSWGTGLVFGLAVSVASTVVLMRVLADNRDLHNPTGHIAIGWLVVEDIFTVVILVLLPAIFGGDEVGAAAIGKALLITAIKIGVLVSATFVLGGRIIPWLLNQAAATRSQELFTLTVLVVVLGVAVGSTKLFGVSMALGAFLAGMVVGRSEFSLRAAAEALPMRDAFAVLFFVSVGMLFEPRFLLDYPLLIAATTAVVLIGKPLAALGIVLLLGYPLRTALAISVALAQIGEFSFILATAGKELGILPTEATNALVATAIISIALNPILYRFVDPFELWLRRSTRFGAQLAARDVRVALADPDENKVRSTDPRHRAIIVGYGPVGQTVVRLLQQYEIEPTVIDLNLNVVRGLKERGIRAIYGDASQIEILKAAEIEDTGSFFLSSNSMNHSEEVIRQARILNPKIRVLARTVYVREVPILLDAGAELVFSGEGEVALSVAEAILRDLGATFEQIEEERQRVRDEYLRPHPQAQPPVGTSPTPQGAATASPPASGSDAGKVEP